MPSPQPPLPTCFGEEKPKELVLIDQTSIGFPRYGSDDPVRGGEATTVARAGTQRSQGAVRVPQQGAPEDRRDTA